jgi:hypothetical protein
MSDCGTAAGEAPGLQPSPDLATPVTDELNRIRETVQALCPAGATITFEYSTRLRINIDTRRMENLARLETLLPTACNGLFTNIHRGLVDNHPFLHRLSAEVRR